MYSNFFNYGKWARIAQRQTTVKLRRSVRTPYRMIPTVCSSVEFFNTWKNAMHMYRVLSTTVLSSTSQVPLSFSCRESISYTYIRPSLLFTAVNKLTLCWTTTQQLLPHRKNASEICTSIFSKVWNTKWLIKK